MTMQDTLSHTQRVHRVVENEGAVNRQLPATSDILHITCHPDDSSGNDIILWSDILAAFKDVCHVRHGTTILTFLKGPDLQKQVRCLHLFIRDIIFAHGSGHPLTLSSNPLYE